MSTGDAAVIADWLTSLVRSQGPVGLDEDRVAAERIAEAALRAVDTIEATGHATVEVPFIGVSTHGPIHLRTEIDSELLARLRQKPG